MTRGSPAVNVTTVSEGGGPDGLQHDGLGQGDRPRSRRRASCPCRPASALRRRRRPRDRASLPVPRAPGIFRSSTPWQRERFTVTSDAVPCRAIGAALLACLARRRSSAQAWNAPEALALVRRAVDRRVAVAGRLDARELSHPRPRVRLLPGAGRRGADRAAPAGQGRRAGRGSVLAGPQPEQAGHPRLARRRLPSDRHRVPPRPSRHRHQQLRRRDPDRRGRRGARRRPSALAGRAWRCTTTRSATRSPSAPAAARSRCARSRSARGPSSGPSWWGRCSSTSRPPSWSGSASASPRRPTSTGSSRTSASCWRTRASRGATGFRTGRRSRSAVAPPGSTFRRAGSSGAAGRSTTTT